MFSPEIVGSEEFKTMPMSSQALYFHLGMEADDDGFVQPKLVMRAIGFADDDLKVLLAKRFLLTFDNGVVVIKHWLIHNMIRTDRYKPTRYYEEKKTLYTKENKAYTDKPPVGLQSGNQMAPQVRLGKDRLGNIGETKKVSPKVSFEIFMSERGFEAGEVYDSDGTPFAVWKSGTKTLSASQTKKMDIEWKRETGQVAPKSPLPDVYTPIVDIWNGYPTWGALKRTGEPRNPSVKKLLLIASRLTHETKAQINKHLRHYASEDFSLAIKNYAQEICNRIPDEKGYHLHRMSLYDFLLQKNGFIKFVNR